MSAVDVSAYPDDLKPSYWDRKKGSLPADGDMADKLKALQKKHEAVNWGAYEAGWAKAARTTAELEDAFAERDRGYRAASGALKKEASDVAAAAQRMGKDKAAGKPVQDAAKLIAAAAGAYADALDAGLAALKQVLEKARAALPDEDAGDEEESGSALLDPRKLLQQLNLCKRDPERVMQFAFVDASDKAPAVLAMSPRTSGRQLFGKLQKETGVKAGAFGTARVEGTELKLQLDKPMSGLVKKLREPVKESGFRVTKIVLLADDGSVFEQDEEAMPDAPPLSGAPGPAATPGPDDAAFATRLKALLARLPAATPAAAQQAKQLASEAGLFARKKDWAQAGALMDQAEALLAGAQAAGAQPAAAPAPGSRVVAPAVVFTQSRLAWDKTRKLVQAELRKLEAAILDQCRDEPDFDLLAGNSKVLYTVLDHLDERLIDKLDEALNAPTPEARRGFQNDASQIVDEYMHYVNNDETLHAFDDNGFVDVAILSSLKTCLHAVGQQLRAAASA